MLIKDLLALIDKYTLVSIEKDDDCLYCGEKESLDENIDTDMVIKEVFPERYGKFYNRSGITIKC